MEPSNKEQQQELQHGEQEVMTKKMSWRSYMNYFINALTFLPVLMLFKTLHVYAVNIPYMDDYPTVLQFLSQYKRAGSLSEKISLFFVQNNEHRIAYSKLIFLAYYKIFGNVNFINLIIINNLHLVAAFVLMVYFMKKYLPQHWSIAAFVTALAMFDINNYENSNAAMFGMQNYGIVLLFLLSLFFYEKNNKKYLGLAVLCQVMCIFSSGAGVFASIALVLYTLLQRTKLNIIASIITSIIFIGLYFVDYIKPTNSGPIPGFATMLTFFLHVVGAHFGYIWGVWFGVMVICALIIVLPINKKLQIPSAAQPFIAILALAFACILATAIFRSSFDMLASYSSRFFIYPHLIVSVIFIFLLAKTEGKRIQLPLTIGCILILLYTYKENYDYGIKCYTLEKRRLIYSMFYWPFPDKETPIRIAAQACVDSIYCIDNGR